MKKNYIGNAMIIECAELPRIGESHRTFADLICIEVKIEKFVDDYIVYKVKYCERDRLDMLDDLYGDCQNYTYAIKRPCRKF